MLPPNLYSSIPSERAFALKKATVSLRDNILSENNINWPMYSPGTINAWLTFLGSSPGNSPGKPWVYDSKPAVGGAHLGVSEYQDVKGYWKGIRKFSRLIFPELSAADAYAQTMVRNLDPQQSAQGPRGNHMTLAAIEVVKILGLVNSPKLIIPLGSARTYCNHAFQKYAETQSYHSGVLYTSLASKERKWFSLVGTWPTGEKYLYVSTSGIHPSLFHVSKEDTFNFLDEQSKIAHSLN